MWSGSFPKNLHVIFVQQHVHGFIVENMHVPRTQELAHTDIFFILACRAPMLESASHGAMRSSLDDDIAVMTEDGEVGGSPKSPKRRSGSRSPVSPFQGTSPNRSPKSPASPNGVSPHSSDSDGRADLVAAS